VAPIRANGSVTHDRKIRLFSRKGEVWAIEFWYNYEIIMIERKKQAVKVDRPISELINEAVGSDIPRKGGHHE